MIKRYIIILSAVVASQSINAQVTEHESELKNLELDSLDGWKKGGTFMLNFSQVSLTNWNAGGLNSFALNGATSLFANFTKGKGQWENSLDLGYGILRQGRKDNVSWLKTDDKIDLFSKYGRKASDKWFYSGLLNFKTQATDGFNYPNDSTVISRFMAPGYLLLAAGMDFKPSKVFSAFIAPLTMKTTFVLDDTLSAAGAFGVELGEMVRHEIGGYVRLVLNLTSNDSTRKAFQNMSFMSKLDLFSNYTSNPERIDINWENQLKLKVNKFISVSVSTQLIYDDDIKIAVFDDAGVQNGLGPRVQFKEILGVGLSYTFQQKKDRN